MSGAGVVDDFYRAEYIRGGWLCIAGNNWQGAADFDTQEEAQDAADEMNGLWYANGAPANAAARTGAVS